MKNEELERLKSIWNATAGEQQPLRREDLFPLIRQGTRSVFSNMRRNLLFEAVFGALSMFAWGYFVSRIAPGNGEAYLAALQMALLTVLPLFLFYYSGFRHLGRGMASDSRLIPALQQSIAYWDQILPLYFWGCAAIIPCFLLSAAWFVNSLGGEHLPLLTRHIPWWKVVLWVAALSIFTLPFVWISIKISYAKHVKQLKAYLRELEEAA